MRKNQPHMAQMHFGFGLRSSGSCCPEWDSVADVKINDGM